MQQTVSFIQFPGVAWGDHGGALPPPTPQGASPLDPVPNLQSSFCRQCAGAAKKHAYMLSQRKIVFCELAGRTAGHGLGGVKHRRPDAFASGENNRKRPEEKASFLSRLFLCFHCARGPSRRMRIFLRSPTNMRKEVWKEPFSSSQDGCRGNPPAAGVWGLHKPPSFPKQHADIACVIR